MLGEAKADWRNGRREAARAAILDAAKELAAEQGLAGLSLRDLARRLGMAAPSLYSYFDSKMALYDALFAAGYRAWLARPALTAPDFRTALRQHAHAFVAFCAEDQVRYQLLFQRTIPGFAPSEESMTLAKQAYDRDVTFLLDYPGVQEQDLDLITAVFTGLVDQQFSNEPGGDRWLRLVDDAVDLLATRIEARTASPA